MENSRSEVLVRQHVALGTSDEVLSCEVCGRDDLKRSIVLGVCDAEGNQTGEVLHAGSDCAARLTGRAAVALQREASAADRRHQRERDEARDEAITVAAGSLRIAHRNWARANRSVPADGGFAAARCAIDMRAQTAVENGRHAFAERLLAVADEAAAAALAAA